MKVLIPNFCLTNEDISKLKLLSNKSTSMYFVESQSKWTTNPEKYIEVTEKVFELFLTEKKEETFSIKASSLIFTLMKQASSISDYISLSSAIISLYQVNRSYSERLLMALKSKIPSSSI